MTGGKNMKTALVLVDIQKDYFQGGAMELFEMERSAGNASRLLDYFRKTGLPRFHIQHLATRPGSTVFLPGSKGAEIHDLVKPRGIEPVIDKHFPNSFRATCLTDMLFEKQAVQLVICGAMSHMCIDSTVRAAFDIGFPCLVAEDGCTTKDLTFKDQKISATDIHSTFMTALNGTFAQVLSTEEILNKLEEESV